MDACCRGLDRCQFPQNSHTKSKKPNVVIIYADDLGYGDLSCYGATAVQTPCIDALAQNGLMFSDAHAAAALALRFAMLTSTMHGEEKTRALLEEMRHSSSGQETFTILDLFKAAIKPLSLASGILALDLRVPTGTGSFNQAPLNWDSIMPF